MFYRNIEKSLKGTIEKNFPIHYRNPKKVPVQISVRGNNEEFLDGRFKVSFNYNTQPIVSLYDDEQYFYAVGPQPNELLSTETVKDFDIDIREITFTKGITATFETNYGPIVKTTHSPLVIERSKIQPMAELVLAPQMEGTIISYESIDGNIVEPKVLKAWDKDGTLLEYINSIVPSSGFGRIVFNGFVETAEISFEDATTVPCPFRITVQLKLLVGLIFLHM